jgi:hypothetical protein
MKLIPPCAVAHKSLDADKAHSTGSNRRGATHALTRYRPKRAPIGHNIELEGSADV